MIPTSDNLFNNITTKHFYSKENPCWCQPSKNGDGGCWEEAAGEGGGLSTGTCQSSPAGQLSESKAVAMGACSDGETQPEMPMSHSKCLGRRLSASDLSSLLTCTLGNSRWLKGSGPCHPRRRPSRSYGHLRMNEWMEDYPCYLSNKIKITF